MSSSPGGEECKSSIKRPVQAFESLHHASSGGLNGCYDNRYGPEGEEEQLGVISSRHSSFPLCYIS